MLGSCITEARRKHVPRLCIAHTTTVCLDAFSVQCKQRTARRPSGRLLSTLDPTKQTAPDAHAQPFARRGSLGVHKVPCTVCDTRHAMVAHGRVHVVRAARAGTYLRQHVTAAVTSRPRQADGLTLAPLHHYLMVSFTTCTTTTQLLASHAIRRSCKRLTRARFTALRLQARLYSFQCARPSRARDRGLRTRDAHMPAHSASCWLDSHNTMSWA